MVEVVRHFGASSLQMSDEDLNLDDWLSAGWSLLFATVLHACNQRQLLQKYNSVESLEKHLEPKFDQVHFSQQAMSQVKNLRSSSDISKEDAHCGVQLSPSVASMTFL